MDGYQSFLNQPLLEIPQKTLFELRKKFLHKIKKNIRPKILKRIKHFRMNDFTILLISASNSFLVESIANVLGIENYLCTRLEIEGGSLTNKIEGIPAYREGKMELLKSWLSEHETEFIDTWAYSDSHNDLPMLEWVKNPVVTYPDHILRQIATTRGWPIID
jgi:HAD superfamily hydrolase (TIGR01490 family)